MEPVDYPDLESLFRSRFIAARKRKGLNQQEVAERLSMTQQTVARFEIGQRGLAVNDMPQWAAAVGEYWRELVEEETVWDGTADDIRVHIDELRSELATTRHSAEVCSKKAAQIAANLVDLQAERARLLAGAAWLESNIAEAERRLARKEQ